MSEDVILSTSGLTKEFGGFTAVNGVDLTCFNLLTKFLAPTRGAIVYNGRDITRQKPAEIARLGLVRSFQISAVFPQLSVLKNVRIALQRKRGDSFDFWRSEDVLSSLDGEAMRLVEAVGLTSFAELPAVELSYGRKRALEIATTLALDPEMMLLDEPMAGMGREDVERIEALIRKVSANRTILMVEHNLSVVASLSDRITVLARGQVLAEGDYATVSKDPRVVEAYIGSGGGHAH
jgi:branched-chain amino acid transport system ATP-binding protein